MTRTMSSTAKISDQLGRMPGEHLAFGFGIHACLGQNLARMEMRVMLEEATKQLPHLRLVEGQEWSYSRNFSFRGPARVLVEWDPAQNPLPGASTLTLPS